MRLLVTGCAGFIGSQLSARLLDLGHFVVGIDNFDETLYDAARHRRQLAPLLTRSQFSFCSGDILDEKLIATQLQGIDAVIHLAALAGVRPSLTQARRYLRTNVEGTQVVLDACARAGIRRIVFASSSSVYGARSRAPFRESDEATEPVSPYAASKRAAELICATHSVLHDAAICALRFFTVYGPWQRPDMAIARFARLILDGKNVPLFRSRAGDRGESARDYTYIDDILDGCVAAVERTAQPIAPFRVYNLGGSTTTSLTELVRLLEEALQKRAAIDWQDEQPGDVPLTCADPSRAAAELSFAPKVPLSEGISRYCEWLKQHG